MNPLASHNCKPAPKCRCEFRHGTVRRIIKFPQLNGFTIIGRHASSNSMRAIVTGWPCYERRLLFQSLN